MTDPAPNTTTAPDEALSSLMGAALNVPIPLIQAAPVQRDSEGYWTHPAHPEFEESQSAEAAEWFKAQRVKTHIAYLESEAEDHPAVVAYWGDAGDSNISAWEPPRPRGDGWFVLSIHDTEDWGPVCVWVRHAAQQGKGGEA